MHLCKDSNMQRSIAIKTKTSVDVREIERKKKSLVDIGYIDREEFVVNLACLYGTHLLISLLIQKEGRGWGIVILASCEHYL